MNRFTLPRDMYYGKDALSALKTLEGKKAVIVTGGSSMRKSGFLEKTENYLKEAGFEVKIFEGVEPDPSVETVMRGAEVMRGFEPDLIVSIGGGSPIDAAKAMWVFYEHPETDFESLCTPFSFPRLRKKARFVAIPSTSGTATEVTAFSVITDYSKGIKYPLADYEITPDVAILDPALVKTLPPEQVAFTGMDALTHAVEAFVSTASSPFTDPLAERAVEMVFDYIVDSYYGDEGAREMMHYAQCLAGQAFTNALLGIVHSMAHKTGAVFGTGHIPHGCANAIYLPYVILFNSKEPHALCRYATLSRRIGLCGAGERALTRALVEKIRKYNEMLGIPKCIKDLGVDEVEFLKKLPEIAKNAVADACTGSNPRKIDEQQMQSLFKCVYYGTQVDF